MPNMYNSIMLNNRDKIVELAQKFDKICKENNIWYSLDKNSLLGAVRHGGFLPWVIKFEVMVSLESILKLKSICHENIVDSSIDASFKSLKSVFVEDAKDWKKEQPFIEIRIVVPTTANQYAIFKSPFTSIRRFIALRKENQKQAIDDLFIAKNEGYFLLDDKRRSKLEDSWIQVLSFKTKQAQVSGIDFPIIVEYDVFLKHIFGDSYLTDHQVPNTIYDYPAPLVKVEQNA